MSRDEYDVEQAPWRNTALPPMLWLIEGYAAIPIVAAFLPFSLAKLYLALAVVLLLTLIRYLGYDALSAYRTLQTLLILVLAGAVIRSVPFYHRPRD